MRPVSWVGQHGRRASVVAPATSTEPRIPSCSSRECPAGQEILTPRARCSIRKPTIWFSIRCEFRACAAHVIFAPYGHDGRTESLRDFIRNVIVGEFAGPEPAPAVLDGLVAYIQDIDFLPNPSSRSGREIKCGRQRCRATRTSNFQQTFSARCESQLCRLSHSIWRVP